MAGGWPCGTRLCGREDLRIRRTWKLFQDKYEEPTPHEAMLIEPFLVKFECESEDFDENDKTWKAFMEESGLTRDDMIKFYDEVRGSKGYDVTVKVLLSGLYPVFPIPSNADEYYYDEMKKATETAIKEISEQMGKKYQLVRVEKLVRATRHALITLTLKEEEEEEDAGYLTVRGIVVFLPNESILLEWKLKAGDSWITKRIRKRCGCITFVN